MIHKAITLFAAFLSLLSVLTMLGCARHHHAVAPYYEPSPGVRLPLDDAGESQRFLLTVTVDNTHFKLNEHIVSLPVLQTKLRQQVALHSNLEVVISASKGTEPLRFEQAMDAVQTANPATVLIATGPEHALKQ